MTLSSPARNGSALAAVRLPAARAGRPVDPRAPGPGAAAADRAARDHQRRGRGPRLPHLQRRRAAPGGQRRDCSSRWRSGCPSTSRRRSWWASPSAPSRRCAPCAGSTPRSRPTTRERTRTLRVPVRLTVLQFALWAGATVLFTLLAVALQPERALGIGLTVGTAAIVVSGVAYLLSDFALRPIAARALAGTRLTDRPRGVGIRSARGDLLGGRHRRSRRRAGAVGRSSRSATRRPTRPGSRSPPSWSAASCSCSGCW